MFVNVVLQGVLLEERSQTESKHLAVQVDDQTREVLLAMVRLGDERISQALAKLFIAGINAGRAMQRASA